MASVNRNPLLGQDSGYRQNLASMLSAIVPQAKAQQPNQLAAQPSSGRTTAATTFFSGGGATSLKTAQQQSQHTSLSGQVRQLLASRLNEFLAASRSNTERQAGSHRPSFDSQK